MLRFRRVTIPGSIISMTTSVHIPHRRQRMQSRSSLDKMAFLPVGGTAFLQDSGRSEGNRSDPNASPCPQPECIPDTKSTVRVYKNTISYLSGTIHTSGLARTKWVGL